MKTEARKLDYTRPNRTHAVRRVVLNLLRRYWGFFLGMGAFIAGPSVFVRSAYEGMFWGLLFQSLLGLSVGLIIVEWERFGGALRVGALLPIGRRSLRRLVWAASVVGVPVFLTCCWLAGTCLRFGIAWMGPRELGIVSSTMLLGMGNIAAFVLVGGPSGFRFELESPGQMFRSMARGLAIVLGVGTLFYCICLVTAPCWRIIDEHVPRIFVETPPEIPRKAGLVLAAAVVIASCFVSIAPWTPPGGRPAWGWGWLGKLRLPDFPLRRRYAWLWLPGSIASAACFLAAWFWMTAACLVGEYRSPGFTSAFVRQPLMQYLFFAFVSCLSALPYFTLFKECRFLRALPLSSRRLAMYILMASWPTALALVVMIAVMGVYAGPNTSAGRWVNPALLGFGSSLLTGALMVRFGFAGFVSWFCLVLPGFPAFVSVSRTGDGVAGPLGGELTAGSFAVSLLIAAALALGAFLVLRRTLGVSNAPFRARFIPGTSIDALGFGGQ